MSKKNKMGPDWPISRNSAELPATCMHTGDWTNGHPRFNYRSCPNLNLSEISESDSVTSGGWFKIIDDTNQIHNIQILDRFFY